MNTNSFSLFLLNIFLETNLIQSKWRWFYNSIKTTTTIMTNVFHNPQSDVLNSSYLKYQIRVLDFFLLDIFIIWVLGCNTNLPLLLLQETFSVSLAAPAPLETFLIVFQICQLFFFLSVLTYLCKFIQPYFKITIHNLMIYNLYIYSESLSWTVHSYHSLPFHISTS